MQLANRIFNLNLNSNTSNNRVIESPSGVTGQTSILTYVGMYIEVGWFSRQFPYNHHLTQVMPLLLLMQVTSCSCLITPFPITNPLIHPTTPPPAKLNTTIYVGIIVGKNRMPEGLVQHYNYYEHTYIVCQYR